MARCTSRCQPRARVRGQPWRVWLSCFHPEAAQPTPPLAGMGLRDGEGIARVGVRKLLGGDKDGSTGKAKAAHASKANAGIHPPLPKGRQGQPSQDSRAPSRGKVTWEDKRPHSQRPPVLLLPQLLLLSTTACGLGYPLGQGGQLSRLCPLPAPRAPPARSLVGQGEEQNSPWCCASTARQ